MTRKPARPIASPPANLRQRQRSDDTWRIWWEPTPAARALGFAVVELDATRLSWSTRRATALNDDLDRARTGHKRSDHAQPVGRTFDELIENYRRSDDFRDLRAKTRDSYARNLSTISRKWGTTLVVDLSKPVVFTWYETLRRETPSRAVALVRMLSILCARAERIGWRAEGQNPAAKLGMKAPQPRDRLATWDELDALVTAADKLDLHAVGTACLMSALSGQRQTDVLKARLSEFQMLPLPDGAPIWVWHLTRSKRGNAGAVKLHPELVERLRPLLVRDAEDLIEAADAPLLICPTTAKPYDEHLFAKHFARVRDAAAKSRRSVKTLTFRDLRRTFVTWSIEGGTDHNRVGLAVGNKLASNAQLAKTYVIATLQATAAAVDNIKRPTGQKPKGKQA
jgi:integrase